MSRILQDTSAIYSGTRVLAAFSRISKQRAGRTDWEQEVQPSALARSFTTFIQGQQVLPETLAEQQRFQLARRAFLRHSFNRLDFVAVVSYWIAFVLATTGLEYRNHIYVFKMLSCLRTLRLLALTHGTAVCRRTTVLPYARIEREN